MCSSVIYKIYFFYSLKYTYSAEDYARILIYNIWCIHGIQLSIISDRSAQVTYRFWRTFQKELVTKMKLSTAFHHQKDFQVKRNILTLDDILRACVIHFKEVGMNIYLLFISLMKLVTIKPYPWLLLRLYMVGDVDLRFDGLKLEIFHSFVVNQYTKLWRKFMS